MYMYMHFKLGIRVKYTCISRPATSTTAVAAGTDLCLTDDAVSDGLVDADDAVAARVVHALDDERLRLAYRLLAHLLLEVTLLHRLLAHVTARRRRCKNM